jgi:xanthine dehydrogenase accessory factor
VLESEFHKTFWAAASTLDQKGSPFVVATLVSTRGHAPQDQGAKAIMTLDGLFWGTIGGGKVEARALRYAQELLTKSSDPKQTPVLVTWNLQRDIGMTCGGEVTFLFEVHGATRWKIALFGAGHVAQAVVRTLLPIDCKITCMDSRAEWLDRLPKDSKLETICDPEPSRLVSQFDPDTFFVVMTQGHATDMPILEAILKQLPEAPYVGSIGSDIKALKIRKELKERGVSPETIEKLRCPIGLELGSNALAEIAISVVAQLLQVRDSLAKA